MPGRWPRPLARVAARAHSLALSPTDPSRRHPPCAAVKPPGVGTRSLSPRDGGGGGGSVAEQGEGGNDTRTGALPPRTMNCTEKKLAAGETGEGTAQRTDWQDSLQVPAGERYSGVCSSYSLHLSSCQRARELNKLQRP